MSNKTLEQKALIVGPEGMIRIRRELPASWLRAPGLLKNKRRELYAHLRLVRKEWNHKRS